MKAAVEAGAPQPISEQHQEWAAAIATGDSKAENLLMAAVKAQISRLVISRIGAQNDQWQDVVSKTLKSLLTSFRNGKYDPGKAKVATFVSVAAKRKVAGFWEEHRKRSERVAQLDDLADESIAEAVRKEKEEREERMNLLRECLSKLQGRHEKYLKVLEDRYVQRLSLEEIRTKYGFESTEQVGNYINYGIKLLKEKCRGMNIVSIFWLLLGNNILAEWGMSKIDGAY